MIYWFLRCALFVWAGICFAQAPDPSWKRAEPGGSIILPDDETAHPDFKTEWWYFTGNLREKNGGKERFGYQLTFFRQGIRPPGQRASVESQFVTDSFWFAHLAISEVTNRKFHFEEQFSRGAFEEAGFGALGEKKIVWLKDWTLERTAAEAGHYRIQAETDNIGLDLKLATAKPAVFQGEKGYSAKSSTPGNASYYYSFTRLLSDGGIRLGDRTFEVEGTSWYDREWSTSLLDKDQVGWDWFAIQFDSGNDLMLFQLRDADGAPTYESGTFVTKDGSSQQLKADQITLTPTKFWKSPETKARYPIAWTAEIPHLNGILQIQAAHPDQELRLAAMAYWEGAIEITGTLDGKPVNGRGYLELTGYAGALQSLKGS